MTVHYYWGCNKGKLSNKVIARTAGKLHTIREDLMNDMSLVLFCSAFSPSLFLSHYYWGWNKGKLSSKVVGKN